MLLEQPALNTCNRPAHKEDKALPLTNSQYESIRRNYENRQTKNRHILNERTEQVYKQVNGYQELDSSVSSVSVECGKRMLEGDENAMSDL